MATHAEAAVIEWFTNLTSSMRLGDITDFLNATGEGFLDIARNSLSDRPAKVVALVVSCIAILMNMCALVTLIRIRGGLTVNLRLLVSLSLSNVCVGMCVLLFNIELPRVTNNGYAACLFVVQRSIRMTLLLVSLLNLNGLAFDHYLASVHPLHHLTMMCPRRTNILLCSGWFFSALIGFSDLYVPLVWHSDCSTCSDTMTFCERVWGAAYDSKYIIITVASISVVTVCCIYVRIYQTIQRSLAFAGRHQRISQRSPRAPYTILLMLGTFLLSWLPYCVFQVTALILPDLISTNSDFVYKIHIHYCDVLLFNSLLDPIIYVLRLRKVRAAFKRLIFGEKQSQQNSRSLVNLRKRRTVRMQTIKKYVEETSV